MTNIALNDQGKLRNGWWIVIFFALLAATLVPLLILLDGKVPVPAQAALVLIVTAICQLLRRRPLTEVTGRFDRVWLRQWLQGAAIGAALMLLPAALLFLAGSVRWSWSGADVWSTIAGIAAAVIAEELLFRGFLFQRLIDGTGAWPAQILIGAYFVLTHAEGLATAGPLRTVAMANIFVASLLFGTAYLRTRSLAMPLGIHFAANFTQGTILGFGVSGTHEASLLLPARVKGPEWLTGGTFGLEASIPGLVVVAGVWILAQWWWPLRRVINAGGGD